MQLAFSPIRVRSESGEGCLAVADGELVGLLVRLSEIHEQDEGKWFLELGLSSLANHRSPLFDDLEAAELWLRETLAQDEQPEPALGGAVLN